MKHTYTLTSLRSLCLLWVALLALSTHAWGQCPATACRPGRATSATAPFIQGGIYSVRLGTTTFTGSGYSQGYIDSSCGRQGVSVVSGSSFTIQVTTGAQIQENVRAYVDFNNNGVFDSTGSELVFSSNNGFTHNGTITIPTTALLGQKLRLRIATDANIAGLPTPCRTPEYGQTRDFWVASLANTSPPIAAFTSADTVTCSGTVVFTDQSAGAPTSWRWAFGDGGTSTERNPSHFYAASGTYSVKLVVRNANGADSLTRSNYIRFNDTIPVAACALNTTVPCCNIYITRVAITPLLSLTPVLNNPSPAVNGGYEDYTCRIRTRLVQGKRYRLALTSGTTAPQAFKAWIDGNGNGTFEDTELIYNSVSATSPADTFLAPTPTGAAIGKPVRLRIITDGQGTTIGGCRNPQLGQSEDYTIILIENTLAPVASFTKTSGTNCDSTYSFASNSENAITKYIWNFGDGSIDSTSGVNVTHSYSSPGIYTVSLIVAGPFGRDTSTVANAVTYVAAPAQATCGGPATPNSCCGFGITRVQYGTIDISSQDAQGDGGYQDFTCQGSTQIIAASPVPFTITTGPQQQEAVYVWVDLNNDQVFENTSERVLTIAGGTGTRTSSITIPSTAILGAPLRVRVLSLNSRQTNVDPCSDVQFGQFEDYSIVVLENRTAPIAAFSAVSTTTCDGTISFIDSSSNATSYKWFFGDGDSSTASAPVHQYLTPGIYTVRLIATNTFGSDTLVRTNFINILPNIQIPAAPCSSSASNPFAGIGILAVQFGQINNTSGDGTEGYKDYTCTNIARLPIDTTVTLRVNGGTVSFQTVTAYIDFDRNGTFETTERIANGTTSNGIFTAQVTFPSTATIGSALRLRIISDNVGGGPGGGTVIQPCATIRLGQMEDYTVILTANITRPPIADFTSTNRLGCSGVVAFRDSSRQIPTSRLWRFGDGTIDTLANPTHRYTTAGSYTVTLIVRNAIGVDSIVRTNYVVYQPVAGLTSSTCQPTFSQTTGGSIFRTLVIGGQTVVATNTIKPTGTYNDLTCTVPVITTTLGDSIQVSCSTNGFNDNIRVYIDANNDGQYVATEEVRRLSRSQGSNYFGGVLLPVGALSNTPLRLRIVQVTPFGGGPVNVGPCAAMTAGQSFDVVVRGTAAAPTANFTFALPNPCGLGVNFTQTSTGGPTTYSWDFGDGNTSTLVSPQNTYSAAGTYQVTLIVSNTLGADTITKSVTVSSGAVDATCSPASTPVAVQINQVGITTAQVVNAGGGAILTRNSPAANEGYQNLICTTSTTLAQGARATIRMSCQAALNTTSQTHLVYLDVNNDGTFDATELLGQAVVTGRNTSQIQVAIPATASLGLLRLRLIAYRTASGSPTCTLIPDGQVEDYGLVVTQAVATNSTIANVPMTLAPNPARNEVRLTSDLASGQATLRLIDALGRVVLTRNVNGGSVAETINLETLPAGVYEVMLNQGNTRSMKRLVVEK